MRKNGGVYRLIADQVGSVRLVIDIADGQVAQRIEHDEYCRVLADTNPSSQPFGFAGSLYDRDTGLARFGARDYDPETGRWTTKDESRFVDGARNLYPYVSADPVNKLDLNGRAEKCTRSLDGFPGTPRMILRHDQIWYEDGTNSGFFDTDDVRPDYVDPSRPDLGERRKERYSRCRYIGPGDQVRIAEQRVKEDMDMDWRLTNNCQMYVKSVEHEILSGFVDERIRPVGDVNVERP
jgi:RHS repeat-associated protein